jgi:hypothetical protein
VSRKKERKLIFPEICKNNRRTLAKNGFFLKRYGIIVVACVKMRKTGRKRCKRIEEKIK